MGCEFDDIKRFRDKLQAAVDNTDKFMEDCIKELAARLLSLVIKRTPAGKSYSLYKTAKDEHGKAIKYKSGKRKGRVKKVKVSHYTGGTLRRGWTSKTHEQAASGSKTPVDEFLDTVHVRLGGGTVELEIINPVEYAVYVENGHRQTPGRFVPAIGKRLKESWAPGKFMLRLSVQDIDAKKMDILEKRLQEFLEEAFNDRQ